jgi:hypothetical protein
LIYICKTLINGRQTGEHPLKPTTAAQPWRQELVFMPRC